MVSTIVSNTFKKKPQKKIDVLIVGAGPVGLTLSNLLALRGIRGACVDKLEDSYTFPRAISLDNDALRIFYQLGLSERDFNFLPLKEVTFSSSFFGDLVTLNTSGSIDTFPRLVSFYQPELEKKLKEKLLSHKNFELLYKRTLKDYRDRGDHYEVSLVDEKGQTHEMSCLYLIGADGAHSLVRKLEGLNFNFLKSYEDTWLILDTFNKLKTSPENRVTFYCDFNKPCPSIPAPGGRQRFEFRLDPHKEVKLQVEEGPWKKFFIDEKDFKVERKATYQFKACLAESFQNQGVFLVGDSAHLTPPFAGQGLVSGLKDTLNLSWKLDYSIKGKLTKNILETYTVERKDQVKKVIRLSMVAGLLASPRTKMSSLISQSFLFFISKLPFIKGFIRGFHFKPGNRIKKGFILRKTKFKKNRVKQVFIGKQFPSAWLKALNGHRRVRSDDLFKGQFCLFCFNLDPLSSFGEDTLKRWLKWGGKVAFIQKAMSLKTKSKFNKFEPSDLHKNSIWIDEKDVLNSFRGRSSNIFIVRPDFIILNAGKAKGFRGGDSFIKESLSFLEKNRG